MEIKIDRRIKTQQVEVLRFWNDSHKLTMIFEPIEETIEIPTGIQVKLIPEIPTNINVLI